MAIFGSTMIAGRPVTRVHMVGIGGAGMSGLARILLARGVTVTGSDAKESRVVLALRAMGAQIAEGHRTENLQLSGALPDVVVTSFAAIPKTNPELVGAAAHNIPVIRRSDLLAALMDEHIQVLIAGTHGKTSTTSMTVVGMQQAGLDPSFAIGGQLNKAGTNAHDGSGRAFVAEADESDASLLTYRPDVAVVTNVEPDHLDFFKTPERYYAVFDEFADRVGAAGGVLIVCLNDPHAAAMGERARARGIEVRGYGTEAEVAAHPEISPLVSVLDHTDTSYGSLAHVRLHADTPIDLELTVHIPGAHMVLNAAASLAASYVAAARELGAVSREVIDSIALGISDFTGVRRRFELKGTVVEGPFAGVRVYDDYAHHPTEVRAVLSAARNQVTAEGKGASVIVCFQPHLFSRTQEFAAEFGAALSLADHVIVLDIYAAREDPIEGVTGEIIVPSVTSDVAFIPSFAEVGPAVAERAQPNDIVVTMGAGSVTMLGNEILRTLEEY